MDSYGCSKCWAFHKCLLTLAHFKDLNERLMEFFHLESTGTVNNVTPNSKILSPEETFCEEQFTQKHKRMPSDNFVVDFPLKDNTVNLGHSEVLAQNRFLKLEQKLEKNSQLKRDYVHFMREYEALGHMQVATNIEPENSYFIQHQGCV